MDLDEEERLQGWRRGDEAATHEIFTRYYPRAVRIARLSGLSCADAQDCAQDAFVQAYERRTQLRALKAFPLWFHRIVTHRILDVLAGPRLRERALERRSGAESWSAWQIASSAAASDDLLLRAEEREEIWRWVQTLRHARGRRLCCATTRTSRRARSRACLTSVRERRVSSCIAPWRSCASMRGRRGCVPVRAIGSEREATTHSA